MTSSKFTTKSSTLLTTQTHNNPGTGTPITITFSNENGNRVSTTPPPDTIAVYAEVPGDGHDDYAEIVGMSNYGTPGGPLFPKGTNKGCAIRLGSGKIIKRVPANYKSYKDVNGVLTMGVRSTDFVEIHISGVKLMVIGVHLPVGNNSVPLHQRKRYRIMKSVFAQAHHLQTANNIPVMVIGDFNTTRAELAAFKLREEGTTSARGKVLIPLSTGHTTLGNFKTCFRFDGSDGVNTYTNIDLTTGTPYDIDHFFVPKATVIEHFEIDRSIIGMKGPDNQIYDHAKLTLRIRL